MAKPLIPLLISVNKLAILFEEEQSEGIRSGNKIDTLICKESSVTILNRRNHPVTVKRGDIITKSDLVVGENGVVIGKIKARNITVAGVIKGELEATGKLELIPTANVQGEAKMSLLVVEEGAVFQGNCQQLPKDQKGKPLKIETPLGADPKKE